MMSSFLMVVVLFAVAAIVISRTQAAHCGENQHCSDCHWETGNCLTKCHTGYYDLRCSSPCSSQCKNNVCEMSGTGIERCTEGCKQGFQGSKCKIPCHDPGNTCKQCPGACDGEYCNIGSSCVAGCNNSFYGSHCSICSNRCKSCNVQTRTCEECHAGHGGVNCVGGCEDDCKFGCTPGFYGPSCLDICSLHCRPNAKPIVGTRSLSDAKRVHSQLECQQLTGDCINGCMDGWYGPRCSFKCKSLCRDLKCDSTGACIHGCITGNYGNDCLPCPENCVNSTCHIEDGSCTNGCVQGFHGTFCNNTCESCFGGTCNQTTGKRNNGCGNNCSSHNCSTTVKNDPRILQRNTKQTDKPDGTTPNHGSPSDEGQGRSYYVVMSTAALVVAVSVAIASVVRKICKKRSKKRDARVRDNQDVIPRRVDTSSMTYETLHRYWDIRDEDVGTSSAAVMSYKVPAEETDGVMPVLADLFGPNVDDEEIGHNEAQEDLVQSDNSYSHLATDNSIADQESKTFIWYLSPPSIKSQLRRTTSLDHPPKQTLSGAKGTAVVKTL